jgi:hypothetical protein
MGCVVWCGVVLACDSHVIGRCTDFLSWSVLIRWFTGAVCRTVIVHDQDTCTTVC